MASLYTAADALSRIKSFLKNEPIDKVDAVRYGIPDDVLKMVWMAAPWRWTVGVLTAVTLASNTQDYSISIPSDWLYPITGYIIGGTEQIIKHVRPQPILPQTTVPTNTPGRFAVTGTVGGAGTVRLFPKPGTLPTAHQLVVYYKKQAPMITASNFGTPGALVMDDEWFPVFCDGVLWRAYLWADDPRAGQVQASPDGKVQYSGHRAVFESGLLEMKLREPLFLADDEKPGDVSMVRR